MTLVMGRTKPTTRVERGPIEVVFENGDRMVTETTVTSYDDWRDTVIGPVNFGVVFMRSRQFIEKAA